MKKTTTARNFELITFKDHNQQNCSLQQSSAIDIARDNALDRPGSSLIWLGVDDRSGGIVVFDKDNPGKYVQTDLPENFMLPTRMHLNADQVRDLIEQMQHWLDTGEFKT